MQDKKQPTRVTAELGDIAAELVRARTKAGLSHSELHRLTGISRTVLIGYENGRTKPGTREIRLLCDALKVTPNRLIYGTDDSPFEKGNTSLPDWIDFDSDDIGTVNTTILLKMLSKEDRNALLTLAHSILESRHGKQKLEESFREIGVVGEVMFDAEAGILSKEKLDAFGKSLEKKMPPSKSKK